MAAPDAWRCEWKKLDPRGRGSIPIEDLPRLLDGLGVDQSDGELEDAATRIQRWQASKVLLQGFLRWFAGDGGSARGPAPARAVPRVELPEAVARRAQVAVA